MIERWKVPVRIDLAGGTLDLWPIYAMLEDCCTVNAAVDLFIDIEVRRGGEPGEIRSEDLGHAFPADPWPWHAPEGLGWVWRVLNAAARRPAALSLRSPVPKGSGLGASSSLGVGLYGAAIGLEAGEALVTHIPLLRDLEARELQTPTGWQDYYPAALGGCLALHWEAPLPRWERLRPHPELLTDLVIFYTGQPHHSGLTNWQAYTRFIDGDFHTRAALAEIRAVAKEMVLAIPRDALAVGELLEREGRARVRMSPAVETEAMAAVRERGRRDGWFAGMKPCGAGGGGCCILVARPGRREEALAGLAALALDVLPVGISERGLHRVP
jgi:D-glycero-alpha-D-manno-heptose-7-phosphate kinase